MTYFCISKTFVIVSCLVSRGVISTIFSMEDNRSALTTESEKIESPSTHQAEVTMLPSLPYNNAMQLLTPSNQYYSGNQYPRKNTIQIPSDHFPYVYEPTSTFGHQVAQYETENSLKPSSKHFVIVSFIGLLLLFAVIQNTIVSTKRRDALVDVLSSRKKRELLTSRGFHLMTPEQEDIFNDDARVRCIQRTVCLQNRKLLRDFGDTGKILAQYLTRSMKSTLSDASGWDRLVEDAGIAGLRGDDCNILYRDCV